MLLARFIARTLARHPLVLLLASRPTGAEPPWKDNDAILVRLGPFDLAETEAFVRSRGAPALDAEELRTLHELTGGHPLHLRHVVARETHGGVPRPAGDGIRAAIAGVLAGLAPRTGQILRRAAVLGSSPSVTDVSAVACVPAAVVRTAVAEASAVGLVRLDAGERFSFSHELVREHLHEQLTVEDRVDAHARAAAALARPSPPTPDRLARYAHHSLLAASRSRADAERAVGACRDAARALVASLAYEQASALLAAACELHDTSRLDLPLAPLLVDQAEATLQYGRLAEARQLFDRAASAADVEHDPVALARAAAGLGGVWVNEHRHRLDWERVVGLQRRALAGLPDGQEGLRRRLEIRLAVEDVYRGGPVDNALSVLDATRRLGDGPVLAEALSLCHHVLLTPRHTRARPALADEQIAVASAAGEGMLALVGLCWRTVDAFHIGDGRAPQLLAELRERADFMGCLSVLYIVEAMEVMLLIRAGRLDEAEARAYACLEVGTQVGDADALGYLGAHLMTIRFLQARDTEMLATIEQIAESPTLNPAEFAFAATVASLAARAGQHDKARTILDRVTAPGLAALPQSSTWLAGMLSIVEAAHVLGDSRRARAAYELLTPYADLPIAPSLAVTCFGSVERVLGLAAFTYGDVDRAVDHLDRAITANRILGNRPFTTIAAADLANALLHRQGPGDRERAATLLRTARSEADSMGLDVRAAAYADQLAGLAEGVATIHRQGRHWTLTVDGHRAVVADRRGVRYLAQLLTSPRQSISALQLTGATPELLAQAPQPVLDGQARAAYRRRVTELAEEIAHADATGDAPAAKRLQAELDALLDELRRVTGRGSRSRDFADPAERARTAVRKAIKRAIDEISAAEPAIGALLRRTVTTGITCSYTPDATQPVRWTQPSGPGSTS
jgi:tetratricopeptide (TPR) repeat protein